jgi:voltage-gated potassium channel
VPVSRPLRNPFFCHPGLFRALAGADNLAVIHPESRLRRYWDFSILAAAIYAALTIPISVVFRSASPGLSLVSDLLVVLVFMADIGMNFNTSFRSQGKLVEERATVARRYVRGWLWLDVTAALPIGVIFALTASTSGGTALQLLRLIPLLKLIRIGRTLGRIGDTNVNPAILRLSQLVFWILLAAHVISCGWMLIAGNPDGLAPRDRYIEAFYWTITTLTTIGYGDITPSGSAQIAFVVLIEILGAGMYGLVIGNIANLIANIDVAKTQYREKLDKVSAFLKYRNIPGDLQRKINNYYTYLWESRRGYAESSVLDDLPDPLKVSVSLFLNKEIIEKVPIFEKASDDLIRDIIMNLQPVVFTPEDYIVRAGETGFDMFFISKGSVDVVSPNERMVYATLRDGQFFGEIALLLSTPRTATIKAREYCDLYRLDKETFDRVVSRYPEFAETIQELAESRRAENEATISQSTPAAEGDDEEMIVPEEHVWQITAELTTSGVLLEWEPLSGAERYEVIRRVPESGRWRVLTRNAQDTSYVDASRLSDQTTDSVTYRVRPVRPSGAGAWSRPVAASLRR